MPVSAGLTMLKTRSLSDLLSVLESTAPTADEYGRPADDALEALRGSGLLGAAVPVPYGGLGGDAIDTNRLVMRVARADASMAIVLFQHFAVTARLVEHGTPEQRERILPDLASGRWLAASAWSETGAGANKRDLSTVAVAGGDGTWELDGVKSFVTGAGIADVYLVLTQTGEKGGQEVAYGAAGQTFFLVEATNPGLVNNPAMDLVGMRSSATGGITLRRCRVPDRDRLGETGRAASIIARVRESGASLGAVSVGVAEAGYAHLVAGLRDRGQLGNQAVRHQLVDLATRIEAARAIVEQAGRRDAEDPGLTTLHSKLFASAVCEGVMADVARMLGSAGFLRSHLVNRLQRDARAVALMGPTNDLCRELVSVQWVS
ncbi:acyl-CoA/acyl-ACP dehydrogenase [Planotetraspora sp. A-T 1434]|uniref:acyl-CoA dehydrogenase family protein n=1 Tax=Planotetraspora sp. A-T 1434 TaxID=2979219 RepID=UPI0021C02427|nr:acyl-CoA dehydrogenase family protein [Planotetraspora sp. A-T 1434]MCT9933580.1 acyl-CoA/acyl-ACP dehydrogenase [Planotetraspora sp. A-T 1434]